jgi:hypothetical protein
VQLLVTIVPRYLIGLSEHFCNYITVREHHLAEFTMQRNYEDINSPCKMEQNVVLNSCALHPNVDRKQAN